ncbi:MAG: DUF115 domain-containing protein [Desulfobacterales bacterium]|nr:DUF115 domain-containing protein [Desulfobacterales bacterium]
MTYPLLLNPFYVYRKRNKILPGLLKYGLMPIYEFQRRLALAGCPVNENDKKLAALKNSQCGKRCFIIGNGPSLRIDDLTALHKKDEFTIAFNKIYLAFPHTSFRPSYYIVEDPLVVKNAKENILALESFPKFFPYDFRRHLSKATNRTFFYLNWSNFGKGYPIFSCNPFALHWGATVTFTGIQFAIFLGCNPIYLIGVDFYFVEPKQKADERGRILISEGEKNHFHPNYRPAGEKWYIPRLDQQKNAFEATHRFCLQNGISVINASRKSHLDVFKRENLDDVLAGSN